MPFSVRITEQRRRRGRRAGIDARKLVEVQAKAVVQYLGDSLVNGYRPADGEARPRKGDGKPLGYRTGVLARGLRIVDQGQTRARASVRIEPPLDTGRRIFVSKNPDVITLDGLVDEVRLEAVDDYLRQLEEIEP